MRSLLAYELCKVWTRKSYLILLLILIISNVLLICIYSKPSQSSVPPSAYHKIAYELLTLEEDEKEKYIESKYTQIRAISIIDNYYKSILLYGSQNKYIPSDVQLALQDYKQVYEENEYLEYTSNLALEYIFLTIIYKEHQYISSYDKWLSDMLLKTQNYSDISIFGGTDVTDNFETLNLKKTSEAYTPLLNTETSYLPGIGIQIALEYKATDILLILSLFLVTTTIIRYEKDSGLLELIRSSLKGRGATASAKIVALLISILIITVVMIASNLVYCHIQYGIYDLSRPVQSIQSLMYCPYAISIREYIVYFIILKFFSMSTIALCIACSMLCLNNTMIGYIVSITFFSIQFLLWSNISAVSNWNVIKYINVVGASQTNEILGRYLNLFWLNRPISIIIVITIYMFVFFCILAIIIILYMVKAPIYAVYKFELLFNISNRARKHRRDLKYKNPLDGIRKMELRKLLLSNGVLWVLVLLCVFTVVQCRWDNYYQDTEESIYMEYMTIIQGEYDTESYNYLQKEYDSFAPLRQLRAAYARREINESQFSSLMDHQSYLELREQIYNTRIRSKISYVTSTPHAHLVYETGYKHFFGLIQNTDLTEALIVIIALILCFSSFISFEYKKGSVILLSTTPLGQADTTRQKIIIAIYISCFISAVSIVPKYWRIGTFFGFPELLAPSLSISEFAIVPHWISILGLMVIAFVARLLITSVVSMIILAISQKTKNGILTIVINLFLFGVPLIFTMLNFDGFKWISVFPIYSLPLYLTQTTTTFVTILELVLWLLIGIICYLYLIESFAKTKATFN